MPTGNNNVSNYPFTTSFFECHRFRLDHVSIIFIVVVVPFSKIPQVSWSQHGIQMQERIPPPQSIPVLSSNLKRMILRNLSWSHHRIKMHERVPLPQSISKTSSHLQRMLLRNLSWAHIGSRCKREFLCLSLFLWHLLWKQDHFC
jgi:hypothetical protein